MTIFQKIQNIKNTATEKLKNDILQFFQDNISNDFLRDIYNITKKQDIRENITFSQNDGTGASGVIHIKFSDRGDTNNVLTIAILQQQMDAQYTKPLMIHLKFEAHNKTFTLKPEYIHVNNTELPYIDILTEQLLPKNSLG